MKTVKCVVCAFFVICVLDITRGREFTEMLSNLPSDFGNIISNAWKGILEAIKSPIKVRRLGRSRKKKTTTTSTTMESLDIKSTYHFPTIVPRRPTIPIILQPKWNSLLDWRILHRPNLVKLAQEFHNRESPSMYGREIISYEGTTLKLTTNDEENHFVDNTCLRQKRNGFDRLKIKLKHYTIHKEKTEGQRKKINIPVLQTPKDKYEYLWRTKFTRQYVNAPYSTRKTPSKALSAEETFTEFKSTQFGTTTEKTESLLKEIKFGKYRFKIYYKLSYD